MQFGAAVQLISFITALAILIRLVIEEVVASDAGIVVLAVTSVNTCCCLASCIFPTTAALNTLTTLLLILTAFKLSNTCRVQLTPLALPLLLPPAGSVVDAYDSKDRGEIIKLFALLATAKPN